MRKILLSAMMPILASAFRQSFVSSRVMSTKKVFSIHKPSSSLIYHAGCESYSQQHPTTSMNVLPFSRCYFSGRPNERYQIKSSLQSSKNDGDITTDDMYRPEFKKGDQVQVEVIFFGPLGASVDIVAHNTHDPDNCIPNDEPALGRGMVLQREIDYFRRGRNGIDVVKYEILPAYIENVYEKVFDDGSVEERIDISLRPPGGKAKAQELGEQILESLKESDGMLDVGDKSTPEEINEQFPGSSKSAFKKAVSGLYKRGLVIPGPQSITLK